MSTTRNWRDWSVAEIYAMAIGAMAAIGMGIGVALHNVGAGLAIGLGLAVAFAESLRAAQRSGRAQQPTVRERGEGPRRGDPR